MRFVLSRSVFPTASTGTDVSVSSSTSVCSSESGPSSLRLTVRRSASSSCTRRRASAFAARPTVYHVSQCGGWMVTRPDEAAIITCGERAIMESDTGSAAADGWPRATISHRARIVRPRMRFDIFTLFPEMFRGPFDESILARARASGLIEIALHNPRAATTDRHHVVDDYPYGGGAGMVMKPEPLFAAVEAVQATRMEHAGGPIILLSPQGRVFTQTVARELAAQPQAILICGHYEGVDERVREHLCTDELSLGDFVLTGGELAAMVIVDAVARLLPGVLAPGSRVEESRTAGSH